MSSSFDRAVDLIGEDARALLASCLRCGGMLAELFIEETGDHHMALRYRRGSPHESRTARRISGVGVRVLDRDDSWYVSIDSLEADDIHRAASDVGSRVRSSAIAPIADLGTLTTYGALPPDAPAERSAAEIRALLQKAADAAFGLLPDLESLEISFQGRARRTLVVSSDGRFARTARSVVGLRVEAARAGHSAYAVGGGAGGLGLFLETPPERIAAEAVRRLQIVSGADALNLPIGGEMPVLLAGGWGGVWLHEVVGHMLEADVDVAGFTPDCIGRNVADDVITVVDDARPSAGRAGARIDDEGCPARRTTLIEAGRLRALLTDRASAIRMGLPETGSGRRQDYRFEPLPRMSNLRLAAGDADTESLVREAGSGLYVTMIGNGMVTPARDSFSFDVLEGYVVAGGHIDRPIKSLRISGRPSETLKQIRGVGNDFRHDQGRGICSKKGQVVPVSVGMPSVLVDHMFVAPLS